MDSIAIRWVEPEDANREKGKRSDRLKKEIREGASDAGWQGGERSFHQTK